MPKLSPVALLFSCFLLLAGATACGNGDAGGSDAGTGRTDAGNEETDAGNEEPTLAGPGEACETDDDCDGDMVCDTSLAGGFCILDCFDDENACPAGTECIPFGDEDSICLTACSEDSDCRDAYICDFDDMCWSYEYVAVNPGGAPIDTPCEDDSECESGYCDFFDEVCIAFCGFGPADNPCPAGAFCDEEIELCVPTCDGNDDCADGYLCQDQRCVFDISSVPIGEQCTEATEEADCGPSWCLNSEGFNPSWPGGYCAVEGCDPDDPQSCGDAGKCVEFFGLYGTYCLLACDASEDCRQDEGYQCIDGACQIPTAPDVTKIALGAACTEDSDCDLEEGAGGRCIKQFEYSGGAPAFVNGYCVAPGCTPGENDSCGPDGICFGLGPASMRYCLKRCEAATDCRDDDGYVCDEDSSCWYYPPSEP